MDVILAATRAKFQGIELEKGQLYNLVRDRGWSALRKKARLAAAPMQEAIASVRTESSLALKDMVSSHIRLGQKITEKAERFVDTAETAKTLSSAASAAKAGISIIREAAGLGSGNHVSANGFDSRFSRSHLSPFERSQVAQTVEAVVVEV